MKPAFTLAFFLATTAGCAPKATPAVDQATVVAQHASMRLKNSSTSRTLRVLEPGDKVEVLEQQENWYRVRFADIQGWMDESTVVTNATRVRIEELVAASQGQASQNTAVLRDEANMRVEPTRTSSIIRKLPSGTTVEVIERIVVQRDESDRRDIWLKARSSPTEVGWLLESRLTFDVPSDISQYTEGYVYTAVKQVNQVQDSLAGPIRWYVVGERKPGADPEVDFNGIRVFTWNLKKHRYETAFRLREVRGIYPLEIG